MCRQLVRVGPQLLRGGPSRRFSPLQVEHIGKPESAMRPIPPQASATMHGLVALAILGGGRPIVRR
jgi:hypothetical protein